MPPSVTTATSSPAARRSMSSTARSSSFPSNIETRGLRRSRLRRRRPVRRVSSAATSADRRQRLARPIGEIAEVADRRADEEEDAAHTPMVPGSPPPTMVRMAQPAQGLLRHPAAEETRDPRGCAGPRRRRARGVRRRPRSSADGRRATRAPRLGHGRRPAVRDSGARPAFAIREARGGARARRTALGRVAEEGVGSRRATSTSTRCSGSASTRGSWTTRARR